MKTIPQYPLFLIFLSLVSVILACGIENPINTNPTAIVIAPPTPILVVPSPKPGTGNMVGRVIWNNKPTSSLDVQLRQCEDEYDNDCEIFIYSTLTDKNGVYFFNDVPSGLYALSIHAIDEDTWFFSTDPLSEFDSEYYTIVADQTYQVGDYHIYKSNLNLVYPSDSAETKEVKPSLKWEAYPETAYYIVNLSPEHGIPILKDERVEDNSISLSIPLKTCEYHWSVKAYNAQGRKIAENDKISYHFYITNPTDSDSCYFRITSPLNNNVVPSGWNVVLSWEDYPNAEYYQVWVNSFDMSRIWGWVQEVVPNTEVHGTSFVIPLNLEHGQYDWTITAYNQFGEVIAGSEYFTFYVP